MNEIATEPLTHEAFAPFGDVLDCVGAPDKLINQGLCGRHHDKAQLDFEDGRAGISLFNAEIRELPYRLEIMERHPQGSQAFIPMNFSPFLITVAQDTNGKPGAPRAFLSNAGQGINFHKNTWHGVLTPLATPGLFAVVDRIGPGDNLEEFWFKEPFIIKNA